MALVPSLGFKDPVYIILKLLISTVMFYNTTPQ